MTDRRGFIKKTAVGVASISAVLSACKTEQAPKKAEQTIEVPEAVYKNRSFEEALKLVAHRQVRELKDGEYKKGSWEDVKKSKLPLYGDRNNNRKGILFDYPWGVTLFGLLHAARTLNDDTLVQFVTKHNEITARQYEYLLWQIKSFGKYDNPAGLLDMIKLFLLDHCGSMSNQVMESTLRNGVKLIPELDSMMKTVADFMTHGQSRLISGTFWRPEMKQTLWVDDIYMSCPFLTRWYEYTGDESYITDAARQIIDFAGYQQDSDGLLFHAYYFNTNQRAAFKWGRANGWFITGTVETLAAMPENHPLRAQVWHIFKKQAEALKKYQAPSGLWRQIVNREDFWEETTCTGLFTYSLAKAAKRGLLDKEYFGIAKKGAQALNTKIDEKGGLIDVCTGTGLGENLEFYRDRPRPYDESHGPGPVLLALSEVLSD